MLKPIFKNVGYSSLVVFLDNGINLIWYGIKYKTDSLVTKFPARVLIYGIKNGNWTFQPVYSMASVHSFYVGNTNISTFVLYGDIFRSQLKPILQVDKDRFVVSLRGSNYYLINLDTDLNVKGYSASNLGGYMFVDSGILKLNSGDFLLVSNYNYYDRGILFARVKEDLTDRHGFKINVNYSNSRFLFYEDGYVYAAILGANHNGRIIIYRYAEGNGAVTTMLDKYGSGYRMTVIPTQLIDIGSKKIMFHFLPRAQDALTYGAIVFDKNSKSFSYETWTVDYGNKAESDIIYLKNSDRRVNYYLFLTRNTVNGNDVYHLHLLHATRADYNLNLDYYRLITYKVDFVNKKLIYKGMIKFNDYVRTFNHYDSSFNIIGVLGQTNYYALEFIVDDESWQVTPVTLYAFLDFVDSLGRHWILDNSGSLYLLGKDVPILIKSRLEKDYYEIGTEPINTNILVDIFNYLGRRISKRVKINLLSKNLEFPDGSKSTVVITDVDNTTLVPVKITDVGIPEWEIEVNS